MGNTGTQDQFASGQSQVLFSSSAVQTIAATVAETSVFGAGSGSLTLPAGYLTVGKMLRFSVRGVYSTPALAVGNVLIKVKLGGTVLASGTASALLVSATNSGFVGQALITCQSASSSGSVVIMGELSYAVGNNIAALTMAINNGVTPSTINTTGTLAFDATVTWSNNTAGNSLSSLNCLLEGLN
jgi:hypothetical protein